jgi:hypothetical protein
VQQQYFNQLKELLVKLKNNQGHFIIQNSYSDTEKNKGTEVYCQLMKNDTEELIRFEALSHHFEKYIDKKLKSKFVALGFGLEKDENYSKNILLNSDNDVNNTALEIAEIFEEIYKVDEQSQYDIDDQIEVVKRNPKIIQHASNTFANPQNPKLSIPKISGLAWIIIISLAIVGYTTFFGDDSKKSSSSKEAVINSELDGSVQQVEDYIKNNLNDPDSYESVSWSEVFKLNDTKEIGFASYQVRHKYRAKNAFGGYVTEEKLFKLDYQGNVVDVRDWIR